MGLLDQFPELDGLSKAQRQKLFRRAYLRSFRHWQTWIALAAIGVFVIGALFTARSLLAQYLPRWQGLAILALWAAQIAGIFLFVKWNLRITIRYMRAELPHCCLNCGYDLRASTGRCPECGTPIPTVTAPKSPNHP